MLEKAKPIKQVYLGRVGGDDYKNIYPPGFCPRDGFKMQQRDNDEWWCPNCGLLIHKTNKEVTKNG